MALDYKGGLSRYRKYLQTAHEQPLLTASFWLILSLILIIFLIYFALRPTLVTISSLIGQINQQEEVSSKLDKKIVDVQRAVSTLQNQRIRLGLLDEALPDNPDWSSYAKTVEQMATESGVFLTEITFDDAEVKGPLVAAVVPSGNQSDEIKPTLPAEVTGISFTIVGTGDYLNIKNFISKLERTRRSAVLNYLQMTKRDDGSLLITINGDLTYLKSDRQ